MIVRDSLGIYESIVDLRRQVTQAWQEINDVPIRSQAHLASNIVLAGMGGSGLGGHVVKSLLKDQLSVSLEVVNDYSLPSYVNENTLVIVSSYSGNTEEALSCLVDAKKRHANIFVITTGGKLASETLGEGIDKYIFVPRNNRSGQPRMGLGYSVIAILAVLSRCGYCRVPAEDIEQIVAMLAHHEIYYGKEKVAKDNVAMALARKACGKSLILLSASHLTGAAKAMRCILNENSKVYATDHDVPESNHNLLEGISRTKNVLVMFLVSGLYPERIQQRMRITKSYLESRGVETVNIKIEAEGTILQAMETISFAEYVSFYLAVMSNIDPGPIFSVDYLKQELNKI